MADLSRLRPEPMPLNPAPLLLTVRALRRLLALAASLPRLPK